MNIRKKNVFGRRDWCGIVGRRMAKIPYGKEEVAWRCCAELLQNLEERDVPKFWDLPACMLSATRFARGIPGAQTGKFVSAKDL